MPPSLNFPQLDFVKPSSGFHPVTWERVKHLQHENMKVGENLIGYRFAMVDYLAHDFGSNINGNLTYVHHG